MIGRRVPHLLLLTILLLMRLVPAWAEQMSGAGVLCQIATVDAENSTGVPNQLLGAISRVETGRYDPAAGGIRAWPWTINAQGIGHFYDTKAEAVAAARAFQAAGIRSIDVGCMQINLMFHPDGFGSLEEAFDPHANAAFAARFLTDLFHQTGSWPHAAAAYHSQTPNLGVDYQKKVLEAWAEPIDRPESNLERHPAHVRPVTAVASLSPASSGASMGPTAAMSRPLGGFGHIIRSGIPAGPGIGTMGMPMGSLAAYRARPVAVAFLPMRAVRD
jgi:hypothetical protein